MTGGNKMEVKRKWRKAVELMRMKGGKKQKAEDGKLGNPMVLNKVVTGGQGRGF